jgi:hypothetical protein
MPQDFIQIFKGSPIEVMSLLHALEKINIVPIVKNPSESARLAGFGSLTTDQTLWVHIDEKDRSLELLQSFNL